MNELTMADYEIIAKINRIWRIIGEEEKYEIFKGYNQRDPPNVLFPNMWWRTLDDEAKLVHFQFLLEGDGC